MIKYLFNLSSEEKKKQAKDAKAKEEEERKKKEEEERKAKEEEEKRRLKEQQRKEMEEKLVMSALPKSVSVQLKYNEYVQVTETDKKSFLGY